MNFDAVRAWFDSKLVTSPSFNVDALYYVALSFFACTTLTFLQPSWWSIDTR
jgi:hypothetical protein